MKKVNFLNVFLSYSISLCVFIFCITLFYFFTQDKNIYSKAGIVGVLLAICTIIIWSLLFSFWSTPKYKIQSKTIYTTNSIDAINTISAYLKKYNYKLKSEDCHNVIFSTSNIITNWFCGDITLEIHKENIILTGSTVLIKNICNA